MSKFKITVEDTETGEQKSINADFYCIAANDFGSEGIQCAMEGSVNTLDIVSVMIGLDSCKERAFRELPDVRLMYAMKNFVFKAKAEIELTEMRRQASQMEEG